ncbi:Sortilin- receptor [Desmophyllum pertusum]|uniref:Sortilin- receptor n=1 Tax=Desmophyllum pertusum TaxID=174260 RepID=A0A9W9Z2A7_9CNID|nr:Sortilin- receptor [Desmophyllum pertusum]
MTSFPLATYDTLFMYWPRNNFSENYVFLLGKNTKQGSDKSTSTVFVSSNYGKNFTKLNLTSTNTPSALIDQIYSGKVNPKLCILADKVNKVLYRTEDLVTFAPIKVTWVPSYITFHPWDERFVMGYDSQAEKLYLSKDKGQTFAQIPAGLEVKSFNWAVKGYDSPDVIFVERFQNTLQVRRKTGDNRTTVYQLGDKGSQITLVTNVDEFEMMGKYMFITTKKDPKDKLAILKVSKKRKPFQEAKFPSNEESRDFFVFDVVEDHVFVVINHLRNLSNMYLSDPTGIKYQLSLPRVLYHNPFTNVSSPWLRTVIPYAFVDVDRIKSIRGIYIATQLTPGPVGKRHLLSLITYNRGGKWQRIRSPTVDNRGVRINCYLPSCSIHLNLLYGAVYRVSPSERLLSSESAPGLVIGLGVASTNLKIYPDLFVSLDGGQGWSRVRHQYLNVVLANTSFLIDKHWYIPTAMFFTDLTLAINQPSSSEYDDTMQFVFYCFLDAGQLAV